MRDQPDFEAMVIEGQTYGSGLKESKLWNTQKHRFEIEVAVDFSFNSSQKSDSVINEFLKRLGNTKLSKGNKTLMVKSIKYLKEKR